MSMAKWNPEQYEKFKDQRSKPFFDLKNLIKPKPMRHIVDLGCGTGEQARRLHDDFKPQSTLGIDLSPEMLERSKAYLTHGLSFTQQDISTFEPDQEFDLVFSNAALQWVPDHRKLLPKILKWVSPSGQVAIQMPFNHEHPSHTLAAEAAYELFPDRFDKTQRTHVLSLEEYSEILFSYGFQTQVARVEIYGHAMGSGCDVIEWTKGTLLTRYQSQLTEPEFSELLNLYSKRLIDKIGERPYYYAFKRALIWGCKNA